MTSQPSKQRVQPGEPEVWPCPRCRVPVSAVYITEPGCCIRRMPDSGEPLYKELCPTCEAKANADALAEQQQDEAEARATAGWIDSGEPEKLLMAAFWIANHHECEVQDTCCGNLPYKLRCRLVQIFGDRWQSDPCLSSYVEFCLGQIKSEDQKC